jgi:hypothetical protein
LNNVKNLILDEIGRTGAIVCEHIASRETKIRCGFRTQAIESVDSGWQFFCGKYEDEDPDKAQIWLLQEVVDLEPTLASLVTSSPNVQIWRESDDSPWQMREYRPPVE